MPDPAPESLRHLDRTADLVDRLPVRDLSVLLVHRVVVLPVDPERPGVFERDPDHDQHPTEVIVEVDALRVFPTHHSEENGPLSLPDILLVLIELPQVLLLVPLLAVDLPLSLDSSVETV